MARKKVSTSPKRKSPSRSGGRASRKSAPKKKAPRKKTAGAKARRKKKPTKKKGRKKSASKRGGTGGGWVLRTVIVLLIGLSLGMAIVVAALRREATETVRSRLAGEVWTTPGRVYSAPIQVWKGLKIAPEELAEYLRAAGYTQVSRVQQPGDFRLGEDALVVSTPSSEGPGWSVKRGEVLISFSADRVSSVSPSSPARMAPAVIATLTGPSAERRRMVALEEIPEALADAVMVMEDQRFYQHPGLSLGGVLRAMVVNLISGELVQGGSTLTQQLAKNLFLSPDRTFARKAREAFLALAIEEQLDKDAILALYLNGIYLGQAGGQAVHGVAEAATVYFGKPVQRLSLGECAVLAGIIPAPNAYSPLRHPERARERRDLVLSRMAQEGLVSQEQAGVWRARALEVQPTSLHRLASWAVDQAVERVEAQQGGGAVSQRGLQLWTSVALPLQRLAERALADGLAEVEARHPNTRGAQAALVVLDAHSGAILAMVGGRDYASSSFNRAVYAYRQVGSVVKPLSLLAALDARRVSLATRLEDEPYALRTGGRTWRPTNYDGQYVGSVSARQAVVHSRNIPCIHLAERVGFSELQRFLRQVGLQRATAYPSVALGAFEATPLQVASAYTLFPGGGYRAEPLLVAAVLDADGGVLEQQGSARASVARSRSVALARKVLRDVIEHGTGEGAARYGVAGAVGGKTGTTDDGRDAWFVGYSSELVAAVWVGFDKGRSLGLSGAQAALPIWARFMAGSGTSGGRFSGDAGLVQVEVCAESGMLATAACPHTASEWFDPKHLPQQPCTLHGDAEEGGARGDATPESKDTAPTPREGLIQRLRGSLRGRKDR